MADTIHQISSRSDPEYQTSARRTLPLTPDNNNDLAEPYPRAIFVGNTGDVALFARDDDVTGSARVFENVPSGTVLHVEVKRLMVTGTAATGIIGLY